jgi:uncharacterized protein (DUF362 family)
MALAIPEDFFRDFFYGATRDVLGGVMMKVFLQQVDSYEHVEPVVFRLLEALPVGVPSTGYVLIKPNLISSRKATLACTHPALVRAVARYFLARGCRVVIGDSPAFGSARKVAKACGLLEALLDLDVELVTLDSPITQHFGPFATGISRKVLDAALVVNLPKLKAHCQMRISAGVKNLFGTVCGFRKPLIHCRHGDRKGQFPAFFVHLMRALPPTLSLVDGIIAMHKTGPTHGEPFDCSMVGASMDTVALDTAVYEMLGLQPRDVPIWRECVRQDIAGAYPENVVYPWMTPRDFVVDGFEVPQNLQPQAFGLRRLMRSLYRRLME